MSDSQRVKDAIHLETFITGLKKAGRLYKMYCPFHNEKTPSFVVNPETQQWRCYGACATGGDVFAFVMRRDGLTFPEALHTLADYARVPLTPRTRTAIQSDAQSARVTSLLKTTAELYHAHLLSEAGRDVVRYLTQTRGLTLDTLTAWQIGLAPASWTWLTDQLTALGYSAKELKDLGLTREHEETKRLFDAFRHRIIFPIHDARGHLVGFGARDLGKDGPKYINSAQSETFTKSSLLYGLHRAKGAIRSSGRAVVVEGYMDVITAHQHGYTDVVAQMGTAFTEAQRMALTQHAPTIVLALDGDTAGQTATQRAGETHIKAAVDLRVLTLDEGLDPDDLIRTDREVWESAVNAAPALVDMLIARAVASLPIGANVLQKQALQARLTPMLTAPHNAPYTHENLTTLATALALPTPTPRPTLTVLPPAPKAAPLPSALEMAILHNLIINDEQRWYERLNARLLRVCEDDLPYALCSLRPIDFPHPLAQRLMGLIVVATRETLREMDAFVLSQAQGTDLEALAIHVFGLPALSATPSADVRLMPRDNAYDAVVDMVFRLRANRLREDMRVLSGLGDELSMTRWMECARAVSYLTASLRNSRAAAY